MTAFAIAALALVWLALIWVVALIIGGLIAHGHDHEPDCETKPIRLHRRPRRVRLGSRRIRVPRPLRLEGRHMELEKRRTVMTNKTHAELIAVARSAALAQPESNPADCAADALLDEIGYEPAPEPPTYEVGTIARVAEDDGWEYICDWDGTKWVASRSKGAVRATWIDRPTATEVIPTYDPATELVIRLDKVPAATNIRAVCECLDRCGYVDGPRFLRLVADLAEQARNGAA